MLSFKREVLRFYRREKQRLGSRAWEERRGRSWRQRQRLGVRPLQEFPGPQSGAEVSGELFREGIVNGQST